MLYFDETQQVTATQGAKHDAGRSSATRASTDSTHARPGSRGRVRLGAGALSGAGGGAGSGAGAGAGFGGGGDGGVSGLGSPPRPGTSGSRRPGTSGSRRPGTSGGRRKATVSQFKRYLERGDLPARVEQRGGGGNKLVWAQDPTTLDLHVFLPVFLDGIRESDPDTRFMAVEGTFELLEQAGAQLTDMLGLLVKPLKDALNTRRDDVVKIVMRVLQEIAASRDCAAAFIPHYRAILPTFNLLLAKRKAATESIAGIEAVDGHSLGDLVLETLETLELAAGPASSTSITQFVPGYRSCFEARDRRRPGLIAAASGPGGKFSGGTLTSSKYGGRYSGGVGSGAGSASPGRGSRQGGIRGY